MSKRRKRRTNFTAEQKIRILREHLLEDVPISDICDRHGLCPSQFYTWQKQLFEYGTQVFHRTPDRKERELKKKLQKLQDQTREKDEVIAEVTKELVFLKKSRWGELTARWVPPDLRDSVVDFIGHWSRRTGLPQLTLVVWLGIAPSK